MKNAEINEAIAALHIASDELEAIYIDNGGEMTSETEAREVEIEAIRQLLNTEGVDSLGRWLKSKEDEVKALKAEKDYVSRKIEAATETIDYIKKQIYFVMDTTGTDKIKGAYGYTFTPYISNKTSVEKDLLKSLYFEKAAEALKDILPADVTFTLGASVKAVPEGEELPSYYIVSETPTVKFTKPRASKDA